MGETVNESYGDLDIIFGGDNDIEATVLVDTMGEVLKSIRLINVRVEPEVDVKINVSSFESGSFILKLKTMIDSSGKILSKNGLEIAALIMTVLTGAFEIKKHLGGEKPKDIKYEGDKVIISNGRNKKIEKNRIVAETYLKDSEIDKSMTNIFNIINIDGDRDSVIIRQGKNNVVEVKKDEFADMSKQVVTKEDLVKKTINDTIKINLLLKKPDLLGNSKWGFVMGRDIYATIADEEWLKKVQNGDIALQAGVKIPVKLFIESDLDENGDLIHTRYTVLEVTGDIIRPNEGKGQQLRLF